MFIYWREGNAGSAQTILKYTEVAKTLGHEVLLYAPEDEPSRFSCSLDVASADAAIFVLEWNMYLHPGGQKKQGRRLRDGLMGVGHLSIVKLLSKVPKKRRVIIDNDGMYNDVIRVDGDYNHPDQGASERRIAFYESLSDKIYQPTLRPLRNNVRAFLFHGYDPKVEIPLAFASKEYGMFYVGSNWFRWRSMQRVLRAIEPIRDQIGRIGLVGHDWGAIPYWVDSPLREAAYYTDPKYLQKLSVEIMPPVPVDQVIKTMSKGIFNPVLVRPLFNHLRLLNPRLFETPAANTIPLFGLDREYVREIYGEHAVQLILSERASEQILDVVHRPEHYTEIVKSIRRHLAEKHSYTVRFRELMEIINS